MKYTDLINKLIPADDLHWCEEDKKYVPISMEDLDKIILNCAKDGMTDMDEIIKVVRWAEMVNLGSVLLKNLLSDRIRILGFENNEPIFGEKK
jgi:hypothetical protein